MKTAAELILLASENAVKVAGEAIQALGGAGYTREWPTERYWRDTKFLDTAPELMTSGAC